MAANLQFETVFLPHLRTQFSRGAAVLFTGAGFSLAGVNVMGQPIPAASALARSLWGICYPGEVFDESTQLQDIYDAALQTDRKQVERLMRTSFTVEARRCPDFYRRLLTMPWARMYTLNVDDLMEKVIGERRTARPVRTISATSGRILDAHDGSLCVVHLNGALEDVPDKVTFGRAQYALRKTPDTFYELLRHDLVSRPVVFIGSTLEEGPLWQHLELRGATPGHGERDLRPRSYLVTPRLNRSKQALLSRYKVEWLPMSAEEFCSQFLDRMDSERELGTAFLERKYRDIQTPGPKILRIADLTPPKNEATEYLLGAEPEWADAQLRRIAHRQCEEELMATIAGVRAAASGQRFIVVSGTAGTGKSSQMMVAALRLEAEGVPVGWLDAIDRFDMPSFKEVMEGEKHLGALFINNADLLEKWLPRTIKHALDVNARLVVVCECRSSRLDRIRDHTEFDKLESLEFTIPYLKDEDIDAILDVLDRENRLGVLKGSTREARRAVFQTEAGRQMLVAMYKATHGKEFKEKVIDELNELETTQRFLYSLVAVGHAHRLFITRDEVGIAFGDDIDQWPRALDSLTRQKLVLGGTSDTFRVRHREIAQFIYDEMTRNGSVSDIIRALLKIAGTKIGVGDTRYTRLGRMLAIFINHETLKRTVGAHIAREIYSEFEDLLAWNYHYWLHRGALELETGNLPTAENFLLQAKGIEPADIFIDNELAYLTFRKANEGPYSVESENLMRQAMNTLEAVVVRRPDQRPWVYHVMGSQGLIWSRKSRMSDLEKRNFLGLLHRNVRSVLDLDTDQMLATLEAELQREILMLAVAR